MNKEKKLFDYFGDTMSMINQSVRESFKEDDELKPVEPDPDCDGCKGTGISKRVADEDGFYNMKCECLNR